jgi:hypothetical protein
MSFLRDYLEFTSGNEAHPVYHQYAALAALSSIVSRRVWIPQGYFDVYPNLYVVLVGPAGNRKTTALSTCKKLLRELKEIPFSAECQTKEALVLDMKEQVKTFKLTPESPPIEYHPITVCVTELSQFLGVNSLHMVDFLTTVYDQDFYDVKTKNKGSESIVGPYLTMIGCTTPSWITSYLKQDVISGGFSRRALFVYETEKAQRVAFPEITSEMTAAWNRVIVYSKKLLKVRGEYQWDAAAKDFYEDWYMGMKIPDSDVLQTFYESKHVQLLKIAMLVGLSESLELVMKVEYLKAGLGLLDLIEQNLDRVFSGLGRNQLNAVARQLEEMLHMAPGKALPVAIVKNQLFKEADEREIAQVVQHLQQTDKIVTVQSRRTQKLFYALKGKYDASKL